MNFLFELNRSEKPDDQAVGVRCKSFVVNGHVQANSVKDVQSHVLKLMVLPGVYYFRIRNSGSGCKWIDFGPCDTRAPDQIPKAATRKTAAKVAR